ARTSDSGTPDATEIDSSAAAAPAPNPTRTICVIASCPASSAVRGGTCPPQPSVTDVIAGDLAFPYSRVAAGLNPRLADHVRQQSKKARALDRLRELALLLCRHRGDAARHDLAALGHVTLQQAHVLVVDLRRIGARERAGLAAAEEWP